jgi:arylamine N-acetyltransferase
MIFLILAIQTDVIHVHAGKLAYAVLANMSAITFENMAGLLDRPKASTLN